MTRHRNDHFDYRRVTFIDKGIDRIHQGFAVLDLAALDCPWRNFLNAYRFKEIGVVLVSTDLGKLQGIIPYIKTYGRYLLGKQF